MRAWEFITETKTLYHGTIIDNVDDIRENGLTATVGNFVGHFYDDEEKENLVFMTDKKGLMKALVAMLFYIKRKLGKHTITDEEFIKNAALVIMYDREDGDCVYQKNEDDYYEHPSSVEDGDYYSFEDQPVDAILVGKKLISFLRRFKLWPLNFGSVKNVLGDKENAFKRMKK